MPAMPGAVEVEVQKGIPVGPRHPAWLSAQRGLAPHLPCPCQGTPAPSPAGAPWSDALSWTVLGSASPRPRGCLVRRSRMDGARLRLTKAP